MELAEVEEFAQLNAMLLPVDAALQVLPEIRVSEDSKFYLRQGQPIMVASCPLSGFVRLTGPSGEFLGVGEPLDDGLVAGADGYAQLRG